LDELFLNENQLSVLPPEIGKLKNLNKLYLIGTTAATPCLLKQAYLISSSSSSAGNKLTSVPVELTQLKFLELLYLNQNQITSLPSALAGGMLCVHVCVCMHM
jgi:Leucine-rich repeat (LRR) protein